LYKTQSLKSTLYQCFKRQLKTTTCFNISQLVAPEVQKITLPNTDYAHKNITRNFSQARSTIPEDESQRIRNMSEFLIGF